MGRKHRIHYIKNNLYIPKTTSQGFKVSIPRSAYDKCHQSLSLKSLRKKKYGMKSPGSRSPFCVSIPRHVYDGSPRFSYTPMILPTN